MRSVSKRVRHIRIVMIGKCPVAVVLSIFLRVDNKFGNGQTLPQGSQADKRTKTQQQEQVKGYIADDATTDSAATYARREMLWHKRSGLESKVNDTEN
ncbi:unnamed protein product [Ceratitis capitata]|uniref:(Mediterranean fruit fly) hypothetical protein n=1 Tax=Ceratitis capitata TaxID=7213 RepID=A0A811UWV4_CERCA|nr:unnamed protein product [Ceratitis capitata]